MPGSLFSLEMVVMKDEEEEEEDEDGDAYEAVAVSRVVTMMVVVVVVLLLLLRGLETERRSPRHPHTLTRVMLRGSPPPRETPLTPYTPPSSRAHLNAPRRYGEFWRKLLRTICAHAFASFT